MTHSTSSDSPQSNSTITSEYDLDPETGAVRIPLGGKKYSGLFALVDPEDADRVLMHRWSAFSPNTKGDRIILYAKARTFDGKFPYLHRFILKLTDPRIKVDHINHDGLDNRRSNLRAVRHQQNIYNRRGNLHASSKFKGVHWSKRLGRWQARIKHDGRMIDLGRFDDEREAAQAYDEVASMLFGSHAYLNFPEEREVS